MIYNLLQYLITQLSDIDFVVNGFSPDSELDEVMVSESGGDPNHWYDRTDWAVQILSRAKSMNVAKDNIENVYNLLKNKYGLTLPEVTVVGTVYPEVETYQVSPLQTPGYLGADDKHLEMFSFNLIITTV